MALTPWEKYKEKNGSTPLDLLNPKTEKAAQELAATRLDICKSCDQYLNMTHQCKVCGCFMELKTKIKISKCPLGKW
jgi:hypothetical protein